MIAAKMILDSVSKTDVRISTIQVTLPKFLLGQAYTHRVMSIDDSEIEFIENISINVDKNLSRNAASSRAIPNNKILQKIKDQPVTPISWGKNRSGMQAKEELRYGMQCLANEAWGRAIEDAVKHSRDLAWVGVHKQICNRVVEPYMFADVIITATNWENFFKLRLDDAAQPEMERVAQCVKHALDSSTPKVLGYDEWHLPYVGHIAYNTDAILCSVAACAQVSYYRHDRTDRDVMEDIKLANRLKTAGHFSPFEHQATPIDPCNYHNPALNLTFLRGEGWRPGITHRDRYGVMWSGNFREWYQYRQLVQHNGGS